MWKILITSVIAVGSYFLYQSTVPIPTNNTKEDHKNESQSTVKNNIPPCVNENRLAHNNNDENHNYHDNNVKNEFPDTNENHDPLVQNNNDNNDNHNNNNNVKNEIPDTNENRDLFVQNNNDNNYIYYDDISDEEKEVEWNEPKKKVWNERRVERKRISIGKNSSFEKYKCSDELKNSIEVAIQNNFEYVTFHSKMQYFTAMNERSLFSAWYSLDIVSFDFHGMDKDTTEIILNELIPLLQVHKLKICLITGKGNHSIDRFPILKTFVKEYLEERDIPFKNDAGSFSIDSKSLRLKPIPSNGNVTIRYENKKKKRK